MAPPPDVCRVRYVTFCLYQYPIPLLSFSSNELLAVAVSYPETVSFWTVMAASSSLDSEARAWLLAETQKRVAMVGGLAPIIHGFLVVEGLGSAKTPS